LPGRVRLAMVVREGRVLLPDEAGALSADDYSYFSAGKDYPAEARQLGIEGRDEVMEIQLSRPMDAAELHATGLPAALSAATALSAALAATTALLAAARHRDAHAAARRGAAHLLAAARDDTHDEPDQSQIS